MNPFFYSNNEAFLYFAFGIIAFVIALVVLYFIIARVNKRREEGK